MLQTLAADTLAAADTLVRAATPAPLTATTFFATGGWSLVVVAAALLAAIAAAVGVLRTARGAGDDGSDLLRTVRDFIAAGNLVGAIDFLRSQDTVAARVLSEGVQRLGRPIGEIQTAVSAAARAETERARGRLELVRTMALVAPLAGLIGTTLGLIGILRSAEALPAPGVLWPALVATAVGAAVGLVALGLTHAVAGKSADFAASLDRLTGDFVEMLRGPAER